MPFPGLAEPAERPSGGPLSECGRTAFDQWPSTGRPFRTTGEGIEPSPRRRAFLAMMTGRRLIFGGVPAVRARTVITVGLFFIVGLFKDDLR